ncbi:MAG: metallophosphoesterase [Deltaproteobacteria bacterium]|jgi:predicted MPP superfamily phosphohydrolase|nr:metallophosphoesterase [Deltaproteobacteria bacterium]
MTKTLMFIIFFSTVTIIVLSTHYYLWLRLIRDTGLSGLYKNIGTYSLIAFTLSFPIALLADRILPLKYSFPLLWLSYFWIGVMMLLFFLLFSIDMIKIVVYIFQKLTTAGEEIANPERREFVSGLIASAASTIVLISSGIGVKNYYSNAVVKKFNVSLKGLPEALKGFKIVQISDLHLGQMMTKKILEQIVDQVNGLKPDLIAITGDLADGSTAKLLNEANPLKNLKADKGIYFVTGNHEYYSGVENWTLAIDKMGIKVLNNENIKIRKKDDYFYLAGVTDHEGKNFGREHASDFKKALSGLENGKKKILLAHQPIAVKKASEYGTDLVLAGHTHGGQIWPFNYFVYLQQRYLKGFYDYNGTKLYVNQGTGCWGPPVRLGSKNEITQIILDA